MGRARRRCAGSDHRRQSDLAISAGAVAPVAVGMVIGQRFRDAVPALMFRRLVLIVVLASGIELVRKAIFS